ncbi:MAG TPA: hypothetical protein VFA27_06940 [Vicinamibacterales bacterium]|nr:hypothetical protein [Vicinamibacterales bacterium]
MKRQNPSGGKRPYRAPRLTVHGDLKTMTLSKKGTNNDGGAKPRTKLTGTNA